MNNIGRNEYSKIFYDSILLPMKTNNLVASVDSETLKKILVY